MRAGLRSVLAAATLLAGLLATDPAAGLDPEEAILPVESHATAEGRSLAEAYADELRQLHAEFRRCHPALGLERHGIAFRRPRGSSAGPQSSLTLWAWLDGDPPHGRDLGQRAVHAFARHGHALFLRLVARSRVFGDPRVGGYGIILSWIRPGPGDGGKMVGESLAVFADKLAAANFVHETIAPTVFLERAAVRAFDGQTEVGTPRLAVDDGRARGQTAC
jgi:hypothetical protein